MTPARGDVGWVRTAAYSIFGGVGYNLFISLALASTSASSVGIVLTTEPVWIVLIFAWSKKAMPSKRLIVSLVVAILASTIPLFGGVAVKGHVVTVIGIAFATFAAISWALFTAFSDRWRIPAFDKSAQMAIYSAPVALIAPLIFNGTHPKSILLANFGEIIVVSLGSNLIAMIFWIKGVASGGANLAALYLYLQPIATVFLSSVLLHQPVTLLTILSLVLVIGSVVNSSLG